MKSFLPIILVLIAVGGAGFAAKTVRGTPHVEMPHGTEEGGVYGSKDKGGKKGKKGDKDGDEYGSDIGYFKFTRDFIVPVMRGADVDSLVLIRISVELPAEKLETFRPKEPRIRDAFMQALLNLSHEGHFSADITSPDVYEAIQSRLLKTAKTVMDDEPKDILIIDFARQDR